MKPNGHTNGLENTLVLPGNTDQWAAGIIEETPAKKSNGHNRVLKRSTRYLHQLLQTRQHRYPEIPAPKSNPRQKHLNSSGWKA